MKRTAWPVRIAVAVMVMTGAYLSAQMRGDAHAPDSRAIHGVVAGSDGAPPDSGRAIASHYEGARVCADTHHNGACGPGEPTALTDTAGAFELTAPAGVPLIADIPASAVIDRHAAGRHLILRAPATGQDSTSVVISPLTTEVARMMDADGANETATRRVLASRIGVSPDLVTRDPASVTDARARASLLRESGILTGRFALATRMVDRRDAGLAETFVEAQQAAMNLEAIPRYDYLFIITLENKSTASIVGSPFAPKINGYLRHGNQFTSYFSSGNPSEPNRVAVSAGDDFGITDDAPWNCMPAGDRADAPDDPLPAGLPPCTNPANHNLKHKANLFSAMTAAGMTWRVYSESMNPGRDWRLDSVGDDSIVAPDHVYPAGSPAGAVGTAGLMLRMPARLYATKHNGSVAFQDVRSSPDFVRNNRTLGGGQWDAAMKAASSTPAGWDFDQLGTDLANGDVGNLNFLEPDQCDDMHGVKVQGTTGGGAAVQLASDCGKDDAILYRGDNYTDALIRKIEASAVWTNADKRTAIVIMFDEGTATTGFNACCGWNPNAGKSIAGRSLGPLTRNPDGTVSVEPVADYNQGNKGHGTSIFCVLTNQPLAPTHVIDSDAYSHISFVRTIQDMFGLADPGDEWSYMNRTKYTEGFIAHNLAHLPEYADSADPHFDAVRPMNHAYTIPLGYLQKSGFLSSSGPQRGPDADQLNPWALTIGHGMLLSSRQ